MSVYRQQTAAKTGKWDVQSEWAKGAEKTARITATITTIIATATTIRDNRTKMHNTLSLTFFFCTYCALHSNFFLFFNFFFSLLPQPLAVRLALLLPPPVCCAPATRTTTATISYLFILPFHFSFTLPVTSSVLWVVRESVALIIVLSPPFLLPFFYCILSNHNQQEKYHFLAFFPLSFCFLCTKLREDH